MAVREKLLTIARDVHQLAAGTSPTASRYSEQRVHAETAVLAPREIDTLRLVAVGMSNGEVAEVLRLSRETVRAYMRSAMRRLDVHNRTVAVHAARRLGLLS